MFKVPIIPPDLRHEETITQAAYALDCLQNTIATIFGRIDKRIESNNVKVKELQQRIKKSQDKINSLQGTRKAIHIYAPARFPATNVFKDLPVTFAPEEKITAKPAAKYQIESKLDTNLPSLNEKLIFFHVRDQNSVKQQTSDNNLTRERVKIKQNQDLGNMPSDLRSVPSVLLFNTDYSVYDLEEGDSEPDAWKRAKHFKNKRLHSVGSNPAMSTKHIIEPAPHSLVNRRNEKLTPSGGLKYTPKLSEAPELDLPLDLPDLPGIADDLRYESQEAKQKIAPSLALVVENLPELTELMNDNDKKTNITLEQQNNNANTTSTPPPPPPPMPAKQFTAPAPPPPPPPPVLQTTTNNPTTNKTKTPSSSDTRSELMAAIRRAGGVGKAALRHTAAAAPLAANDNDVVDNTRPSKTVNSSRSPQTGGDLMADLHNKLLMRRKGISGSKDTTDSSTAKNANNTTPISSNTPSGNPVISRLSALIPPPPPAKAKNTATATTTSDEDDSNDTDWVD